ncbi:MAG: hypothetical protein JKY93_12700 [Gammaproteobacteria bacterium]|nr:hypothetical protein [Gammaproteobacteria bacterium]
MNFEAPEKLQGTVFVSIRRYKKSSSSNWYIDLDMEKKGGSDLFEVINLTTFEVDIDIPSVDINTQVIEGLKKQKTEIQANAEREIQQIDEQIQSMLAIEHQPKVAA